MGVSDGRKCWIWVIEGRVRQSQRFLLGSISVEEEIIPRSTYWLILHMNLPIGQILKGLGKTHSESKCQLLAFYCVRHLPPLRMKRGLILSNGSFLLSRGHWTPHLRMARNKRARAILSNVCWDFCKYSDSIKEMSWNMFYIVQKSKPSLSLGNGGWISQMGSKVFIDSSHLE